MGARSQAGDRRDRRRPLRRGLPDARGGRRHRRLTPRHGMRVLQGRAPIALSRSPSRPGVTACRVRERAACGHRSITARVGVTESDAPSGADEGIRIAARLRMLDSGVGVVALASSRSPSTRCLLEHGSHRRAYLLKERIRTQRHRLGHPRRRARRSAFDAEVVDALIDGAEESFARPHATRARGARRGRAGQEQRGDRGVARAHERLEKHINSIFGKLGLTGAQDISHRVKAALMFLDDPS